MTGAVGMEAYEKGKLLNKGAFGAAYLVGTLDRLLPMP